MGGVATGAEFAILAAGKARRTADDGNKYVISELPSQLSAMQSLVVHRGSSHVPGSSFKFQISATSDVYLVVHQRGGYKPPAGWEETDMRLTWFNKLVDKVYKKRLKAGAVEVPGHDGTDGSNYGLPHMVFVGDGVEISAVK